MTEVAEIVNIDVQQTAKNIVRQVLETNENAVGIPPRFEEIELEITEPPNGSGPFVGLLSSGSTGTPKCLWNSKNNLLRNGEISLRAFGLSKNDRLLILASPWHVAGLSWALMAESHDISYHIETPYVRNSADWIGLIQDFKPTMLLTVPSVLRYLGEYDGWFIPAVAFGGASLQTEDYDTLRGHCDEIIQAYGQTEAGGLISLSRKYFNDINPETDYNCVGKTPPEFAIETTGTLNYPDTIFLTSPTAITSEKYNTGDIGFIDENGELHLTGRANDSSGDCNMITAITSVAHK